MPRKKPSPPYMSLVPGKGVEGDYQPNWDEWCIPASDTKGHSMNPRFRMPEALYQMTHSILKSGYYPYKDVGYVVRHALLRHYFWLKNHPEYKDGVGSTIYNNLAMVETCREEEYMEDLRCTIERMDEIVRKHRMNGNTDRARKFIKKQWTHTMRMTDEFWREEYQKEFERRFGDLVRREDMED